MSINYILASIYKTKKTEQEDEKNFFDIVPALRQKFITELFLMVVVVFAGIIFAILIKSILVFIFAFLIAVVGIARTSYRIMNVLKGKVLLIKGTYYSSIFAESKKKAIIGGVVFDQNDKIKLRSEDGHYFVLPAPRRIAATLEKGDVIEAYVLGSSIYEENSKTAVATTIYNLSIEQ